TRWDTSRDFGPAARTRPTPAPGQRRRGHRAMRRVFGTCVSPSHCWARAREPLMARKVPIAAEGPRAGAHVTGTPIRGGVRCWRAHAPRPRGVRIPRRRGELGRGTSTLHTYVMLPFISLREHVGSGPLWALEQMRALRARATAGRAWRLRS